MPEKELLEASKELLIKVGVRSSTWERLRKAIDAVEKKPTFWKRLKEAFGCSR